MNAIREKALGRRVRACVELGCRVSLYLVDQSDVCPGCGSEGVPVNDLAHRERGAAR